MFKNYDVFDNNIKGDVHVGEGFNSILIIPRDAGGKGFIRTHLKIAFSDTRINMKGGSYLLDANSAFQLLSNPGCLNLQWTDRAKQFVHKCHQINRDYNRIKSEVDEIISNGKDYAKSLLMDMDTNQLDDHQIINIAAMSIPNGFGMCIFDEQGAGKTVTSIFAYDILVERDEIDFALIVAPKSMIAEWPQDIQRFKKDLYKVEVMSGTITEKRKTLSSRADVIVTNYETVVSMEDELISLLKQHHDRSIIIVDESFFIKNKDAKRTKALTRLREWCTRAFILCGTPAPNSPLDLVEQFNFVDMGYTFKDIRMPEDRNSSLQIIKKVIEERGIYVRHLKQEVLPDLPQKNFQMVLVKMSSEQRNIYEEALNGYLRDLKKSDEASFNRQLSSFLAKRSALLQICSNPSSVTEGYTETPAKLLVLDEILEELIERRGEKVVLWSFYRKSLDTLFTRYKRYCPVRYDGTVSSVDDRRNFVRLFQEDPKVMLFIGNPAAAGAGLTLHRARYAIYESYSDQAAHYMQSLDRIHRRGQTRDVEYIALIADQSIEVTQYQTIQSKEKAARDLLGDDASEKASRLTFINEAENAVKLLSHNS